MAPDEWDCERCQRQHDSGGWRCEEHGMAGPEQCPRELIDGQTADWMRQYAWLRREGGGLWYPGGPGRQPQRYLAAMERLGAHVGRLQEELTERQQAHLAGGSFVPQPVDRQVTVPAPLSGVVGG